MTASVQTVGGGIPARTLSLPWIIGASSVGTLVEWYDFYIYGVLAVFFAQHFFPPGNPGLALLASLAVFWFGFIARPFGAILFGHLGDLYDFAASDPCHVGDDGLYLGNTVVAEELPDLTRHTNNLL
jgi:MFS family permease